MSSLGSNKLFDITEWVLWIKEYLQNATLKTVVKARINDILIFVLFLLFLGLYYLSKSYDVENSEQSVNTLDTEFYDTENNVSRFDSKISDTSNETLSNL